jgi:hypothetical protein
MVVLDSLPLSFWSFSLELGLLSGSKKKESLPYPKMESFIGMI